MKTLVPAGPLALACLAASAFAQTSPPPSDEGVQVLAPVEVDASADASAEGLSPAYAGGQVARGGRAGILGTRDYMSTPVNITSYTNDLIQDRQAQGVGDVLQNDPGVRMARGFGNFQESYFIRGFILGSDDIAYNGLYSLLPRQYIATELFERVEVLRGASTFLTGATPGDGGLGGNINLVPKRAPNEPLTRLTLGAGTGIRGNAAVDIARRFGPDQSTGIRFNAGYRDGETGVSDEHTQVSVVSLGLDWRSSNVRLSADVGWQENQLRGTRPSVTLNGATKVPSAPDASSNFAQRWTYSNERDLFGTVRGEVDLNDTFTAWGALGMRRSEEANSLANVTVTDANGDGEYYRFDNTREDSVNTGEIGIRGKLRTGTVSHELVASAAHFQSKQKNAYVMDWTNTFGTNIHNPTFRSQPAYSADALVGNDLDNPGLTGRVRLSSLAAGDTLGLFDDTLLVTLGARYQRIKSQSYAYTTGTPDAPYDKSRVSPMAGVVFKLDKQVSLYGNYIEGLTTGPTAPRDHAGSPVANGGQMFSPYVTKQKEVGVKYDGGGIGAGLALFSTDKPSGIVTRQGTEYVYSVNGKDRHQGAELTVFGQPAKSVRVLGGLTFLDAKQRETGLGGTNGKRVIGVPEFQATLGAEWDIPGVSGLAVDGRVVYSGASYADAANTLKVGSWTRLDVGLRYMTEIQGKLVTWRARINNLTDRSYWASVGGYPGSGYLVAGAPRTFYITASTDF